MKYKIRDYSAAGSRRRMAVPTKSVVDFALQVTLRESLESGQNRMGSTTALHLLRASDTWFPYQRPMNPGQRFS